MNSVWADTIDSIPKKSWDEIYGNNVLKSYELMKSVERARLSGITNWYLKMEDSAEIKGVFPCFTYTYNLELLTSGKAKIYISFVQRLIPGFLKIKIFFIGTPIAICDHLIGIKSDVNNKKEIFSMALQLIKEKSKELNCLAIILKEIPESNKILMDNLCEEKFILAESLPNSYVFLDKRLGKWLDPFRTRYRKRIKKQMKNNINKNNYTWELVENFGQYSKIIERLYLNVLEKSDYKFETLNDKFFCNLSENMLHNSYILICRNKEREIVCFELIFEEKNSLIPIYLGIDYSHLELGDLYFTCIHKIIQIAEEKKKDSIKLGQTSYLSKAYAGAVFENLKLGIYSQNVLIHYLFKKLKNKIFSPTNLPEQVVYKENGLEILREIAKEKSLSINL